MYVTKNWKQARGEWRNKSRSVPTMGYCSPAKAVDSQHMQNVAESQRHCAKLKKLDTQAFTLNPIYMTFSKKKT